MIRGLLLLLLLVLPWGLTAKPLLVRSGEHADFSRIVIQFDTLRDWKFGRVENGYELRVDAPGTSFDISDVFKFIPRSRIDTITLPGPGRLTLALACRCIGDAFEVRPGRLVVDIKSGSGRPNEEFEKILPEISDGSAWPAQQISTPPTPILPFWRAPISASSKVSGPALAARVPRQRALPVLFSLLQQNADSDARPDRPGIALPVVFSESGGQNTALSGLAAADMAVQMPLPAATAPDAVKTPDTKKPRSLPPPSDPTDPFGPPSAATERVAIAKSELLLQLARASTQGLVKVDPPAVVYPSDIKALVSVARDETLTADPDTIPAPGPIQSKREHLRIETVVDRDRTGEKGTQELDMSGVECLDPALFDVLSWGPQNFVASPFGALRANIVREFDKPDSASIVALARRYIFLGFGVETKALLNSFDAVIPNSDILIEMGELMDFGAARTPGRLAAQISCSTDGAMWAVLSVAAIPKGADIDTRSVLKTFSGLPPHLRQLLGPGLADRFLVWDDVDTATAVRDLIDRMVGDRDSGFQMLDAQLNAQEGNIDLALELLAQVSVSGGELAGDAVVQLIQTKLDAGMGIDQKTAQLADTLAVENRGTPLGRRLTRAAILGFAVSGQVDTTFERIETAVRNADITPTEARDLRARAHIQNAKDSSNTMFLRMFFRHEPTKSPVSPAEVSARRAIAGRLVELGLPDQALAMYANANIDLGAADHRIMAGASLAIGDAAAATRELGDLQDVASQRMRASAEEMMGKYSQAAKIFAALDLPDELSSAAWRAGDWPAVASAGTSVRSQAAALATVSDRGRRSSPIDAQFSGASAEPIAFSRSLVSKSEKTRAIIASLLE